MSRPPIHPEWLEIINQEMENEYMKNLVEYVKKERETKIIYPDKEDIFNCFRYVSPADTRVVILGQDPYHGPGDANGLAFSSNSSVTPASLKNIFKEIRDDYWNRLEGYTRHNNLIQWAKQGVLLMNRTLTVEKGKAGSHFGKGWELLTSRIIQVLNMNYVPVVFILWGKNAQVVKELITEPKHLILEAPHPSPYSADKGFLGCKHFTQANKFIANSYKERINTNPYAPGPIGINWSLI